MACRRSKKFLTGVVAAGASCPAVVVWGAAGGLDTCSAELFSEVGDGELCDSNFTAVFHDLSVVENSSEVAVA